MNIFIAPIAAISVLSASFFIIDNKDVYSCDNEQNIQIENVVSSREKLKPLFSVKDHLFATGVNSEEKDVGETKHEEESNPVSIPVFVSEESQQIKKYTQRAATTSKEPFYEMYQDVDLDKIGFEGTVSTVSTIPDPVTNDYPNCLYALFVDINSVLCSNNDLDGHNVEKEVIINVPILKDKKVIEQNRFSPGDKVFCVCVEYDMMPQEIQEIQISDDIQSFEHQQFFAITTEKIEEFQTTGNKSFAKRTITIPQIQTLPKDENASKLRKERIQSEIARIEQELERHGGSFDAWKEEFKPLEGKYKQMCEDEWEGWINDSYFSASAPETTYRTQSFIKGILPYKKYLEEHNIDLIVVRVPSKGDFAARVLVSDTFQENPAWIENYYECLKSDIEIVDPMPEMWNQRFNFPMFYYYNRKGELHPFEGFSFVSAQVLSEVLKRYGIQKSSNPISLENAVLSKKGFWPGGNTKYLLQPELIIKKVVQNEETIGSLKVNTGAPFLFLSNSYFEHPKAEWGASVPGYTAFFLQNIPDWMLRRGSGNQIMRLMFQDNSVLSKRKAVIMGVHPTAQWQGFPKLPKYLTDNAKMLSLEKTIDFMSPEISIIEKNLFKFEIDGKTTRILKDNTNETNKPNSFTIELSIPDCKNMSTCVLRVNFKDVFRIGIRALNPNDNTVIDSVELAQAYDNLDLHPASSHQADLYIPARFFSKSIRVEFILYYPNHENSIKNIELWYY